VQECGGRRELGWILQKTRKHCGGTTSQQTEKGFDDNRFREWPAKGSVSTSGLTGKVQKNRGLQLNSRKKSAIGTDYEDKGEARQKRNFNQSEGLRKSHVEKSVCAKRKTY